MEDELLRGWRQDARFAGTFGGYTVQGFKYSSDGGEVGWHTTSWPMRDPVHDFWVSGTTFHKVKVYPPGEVSSRQRVEIFEVVENADPEERAAVLDAIKAWDLQLDSARHPESSDERSSTKT